MKYRAPTCELLARRGECFPNEFCSLLLSGGRAGGLSAVDLHGELFTRSWRFCPLKAGRKTTLPYTRSPIWEIFMARAKLQQSPTEKKENGQIAQRFWWGMKTIHERSQWTREYTHSFRCLRGVLHIYAPLLRRLLLYQHHAEQIECQFAIRDMKHWETSPQGQFSTCRVVKSCVSIVASIFNFVLSFHGLAKWNEQFFTLSWFFFKTTFVTDNWESVFGISVSDTKNSWY